MALQRPTVAKSGLYSIPWGESRLTANDKLFFLSVRELADYVGNYLCHTRNGCNEHIVERE